MYGRKNKEKVEIIQYRNVKKYTAGEITTYRIPVESFPSHVTNVYLIINSRPFLVDTGLENEKARQDLDEGFQIIQSVFQENVSLEDVEDVVITHGHIDHFGMIGNEKFKRKNLYIHKEDSEIIRNYDKRTDYALARIDSFLKTAGVSALFREGIINLYRSDKKKFKPKNLGHHIIDLRDNDKIIDGYRVYHTPGHCPGAICLEVGDFIFTGDHLLSRITPHQSPGFIMRGTGLRLYLNSLNRIFWLSLQKDLYGLPGHEEDIYPVADRVDEIKRFHEQRLRDIEKIYKEGKSIFEITVEYFNSFQPEIFSQPDYPDYNKLFAILEIGAHVEYLEEEGRLRVKP